LFNLGAFRLSDKPERASNELELFKLIYCSKQILENYKEYIFKIKRRKKKKRRK